MGVTNIIISKLFLLLFTIFINKSNYYYNYPFNNKNYSYLK